VSDDTGEMMGRESMDWRWGWEEGGSQQCVRDLLKHAIGIDCGVGEGLRGVALSIARLLCGLVFVLI